MIREAVFMIAAAFLLQQNGQTPLRVNVDLVNVPFTVTDRAGRFVSGLKQSDFTIEEDTHPQVIQRFNQENELPLTIGILVDKSGSVAPVFAEEKAAADSFLDSTLKPGDLAMVISFDRVVTLEQDFTEDKKSLRDAINRLTIGSGTSIFDAVYLAAKEQLSKQAGRKAIVLISDGKDTGSKVSLGEALMAAHQSDASVFSVSNRIGGFFDVQGNGDPATLKRFSLETGGTLFFVGGRSDLREVFSEISDELRSQYSLAYTSADSAHDGKYRHIRIIPKDPSYKVKSATATTLPPASPWQ
jgi:VWFA-related protein